MEHLAQRYLAARRAVLEAPFAAMNPSQRAAVLAPPVPMLILAGAGSGKTTVLVNRIAYLLRFGPIYQDESIPEGLSELTVDILEEYAKEPEPGMESEILRLVGAKPVKPWSVLAVTFTNKAARELKERLSDQVGPGGDQVVAGTFHSLCARILRKDADCLGYPRDFTIYDTDDSRRLMKECIREAGLDDKKFPPPKMLGIIGRAKDALQGPEEFAAQYKDDFGMRHAAKLYAAYQARLAAAGAMDFDDLIFLTVRLLRQEPELREYYARRFAFVMVDEYQDTNHAQFVLTELLSSGGVLMVVGDDDQSIYKFRGATIENILSFERRHRDAAVVRLEQNYRSTGTILDCANGTIANNLGRKGKRLWTQNERGEPARLYVAQDSYDEARFIAETVLDTCAREARDYGDFAVLYRTNAQSAAIEEALLKSGVPYRIYGGMKFYERKEVKDVVSYLTVLVNPRDDLRLRRILNEPKRGIGDTTVALMEQLAAASGLSLLELIGRCGEFPELARQKERLTAFYELIEELRELSEHLTPSLLLEQVVERTGYLAMLRQLDAADGRERTANIDTLADNIRNYEQGVDAPTLAGFLEGAALATDLDNYEEGAGSVSLMTMHSAKGLEFPIVFLTGMEEELFPSQHAALDPVELEEERRLCYVAITRAKQRLYLTAARLRRTYNMTRHTTLSRFLGEIPKELVQDVTPAPAPLGRGAGAAQGAAPGGRTAPHGGDRFKRRAAPGMQSAFLGGGGAPAGGTDGVRYSAGESVVHKKFGRGVVRKVKDSGGDQMLTIEFETVGTKLLMARFAAAMLKKEE